MGDSDEKSNEQRPKKARCTFSEAPSQSNAADSVDSTTSAVPKGMTVLEQTILAMLLMFRSQSSFLFSPSVSRDVFVMLQGRRGPLRKRETRDLGAGRGGRTNLGSFALQGGP